MSEVDHTTIQGNADLGKQFVLHKTFDSTAEYTKQSNLLLAVKNIPYNGENNIYEKDTPSRSCVSYSYLKNQNEQIFKT